MSESSIVIIAAAFIGTLGTVLGAIIRRGSSSGTNDNTDQGGLSRFYPAIEGLGKNTPEQISQSTQVSWLY